MSSVLIMIRSKPSKVKTSRTSGKKNSVDFFTTTCLGFVDEVNSLNKKRSIKSGTIYSLSEAEKQQGSV